MNSFVTTYHHILCMFIQACIMNSTFAPWLGFVNMLSISNAYSLSKSLHWWLSICCLTVLATYPCLNTSSSLHGWTCPCHNLSNLLQILVFNINSMIVCKEIVEQSLSQMFRFKVNVQFFCHGDYGVWNVFWKYLLHCPTSPLAQKF